MCGDATGTYRFKTGFYGLTDMPTEFQKAMDCALQGLEGVICYLDDILPSINPPFLWKSWIGQFFLAVGLKDNINPEDLLVEPAEVIDEPPPRAEAVGATENSGEANARIHRDQYITKNQMPNIHELIDSAAQIIIKDVPGKVWFTSLDLSALSVNCPYRQLPVVTVNSIFCVGMLRRPIGSRLGSMF